jgi:hypothetical protein
MISFNERGCDEIMCQFIEDVDPSYDILEVEFENEIEPKNFLDSKL